MKRAVIALAALGAVASMAGVANAQSNVRIYGNIDTGYVRESGRDAGMACNYGNMIGFAGAEDLGGGFKAIFAVEEWLELNDGDRARRRNEADFNSGRATGEEGRRRPDFQGQAVVGLQHNDWGAVRLGRVYNLAIENYRRLDPFFNFSVGANLAYGNNLYAETLHNSLRYDSPVWSGFSFGLSYSLGEDEHDSAYYKRNGNDGFNVTLKYDNGPLFLTGNYHRMADTDNSWAWNVGGAYTWGPATVSLGYQDSRSSARFADTYAGATGPYTNWMLSGRDVDQSDATLGLVYRIGSGQIQAGVSWGNWDDGVNDEDIWKYSLGYTHFLSKRTSLYGMVSYLDAGNAFVGKHYNFTMVEKSEIFGIQVGLRHTF
ncbi:porin [Oxalobacter vibrioformis]|uniref:Porin n=1 Tax=Oxalobacter vibrioformis TaxID=933080 RepID=A0A9E9P3E5_9BURK|nr:porin [Oxalobacter vibrioformis]WAW09913.1 porin [Oxalobacter vibrioformis]